MTKKFYAVKNGRETGIFYNWEDCKKQVIGFKGAIYKSFLTEQEAMDFIEAESKNIHNLKPTEDSLIAYVDGSYNGSDTDYSYGVVIIGVDGIKTFSKKMADSEMAKMHNVAGEISGSMAAMNYCLEAGMKEITIFYDYQGIENWCTGAWKTNKEGTRKYKEFYDEISEKIKINFVKVKGHSNNEYNDMADALAKKALDIH